MKRIIAIFGLLVSGLAFADDADQCTNVISAAKTTTTILSDQQEVQSQVEDFCNEYSQHQGSSESLSSSASYYFLSGSLGLSHASVNDIASKYCSKSNHYAARSDSYHQYLEGIAPQAYDAYKSCLEYAHAQVKFYVLGPAIKPKELVMYARYASTYAKMTYALLQVQPSAGVSCAWDSTTSDTAKVMTANTVKLHCTRDAQGEASFVAISNKNDASTQPFVLPWTAYAPDGTPIDSLKAVTSALTNLQAELTRVSAEAQRSAEELARARANDDHPPEFPPSGDYGFHPHEDCGKGQVVSGVHWWFFGEKLQRIAVQCRDLVPPPPPSQ